jgi:hypothetical protein
LFGVFHRFGHKVLSPFKLKFFASDGFSLDRTPISRKTRDFKALKIQFIG